MDVDTVERCRMCTLLVALFFIGFGFVAGMLICDAIKLSVEAMFPGNQFSPVVMAWLIATLGITIVILLALLIVLCIFCDRKWWQVDAKLEKKFSMNAAFQDEDNEDEDNA